MKTRWTLAAAVISAAVSTAMGGLAFNVSVDPEPGTESKITLTTGEVLTGTLVSSDEQNVVIDHPVMGRTTFSRGQVKEVAHANPPEAPDPETFFKGWSFFVDAGVTGATGNTERLGARAAFGGNRETSRIATSFGLAYLYAEDDGSKSQDRFDAFIRNDWKLGESPWRVYARGEAQYDYFQEYDWRVTGVVGMGYVLIDNDSTFLMPRAGIAVTREIGGSDNRWIPELNLGFDFTHKFNDTAKFFLTFDSFWTMLNFPGYRLVAATGMEFLLDSSTGMVFKIGAEERYNSSPGADRDRSDLTYFATVGWRF